MWSATLCTWTVCAVDQLTVVKVRFSDWTKSPPEPPPATRTSSVVPTDTGTVTVVSGFTFSATVKVFTAPPS